MFLGKYNTARHIYIPIVKRGVVDHAVSADWTPAAGDVKISKDGGAAANVTNLPTAIAMGNSTIWDFSLTSTEMSAAQVMVTVADSATKAVEDTGFIVETYGNASAQHIFDLGTATQKVDIDTIKTQSVTCSGGVTVPAATLASTTNITAGTITTTTNLTTNNDKTGYGLSSAAVSAIWQDTTAGDFTAANSIGKSIMNGVSLGTGLTINAYSGNTPQTGDAYARLGAPAGASVSADIAAIKTDTGTSGSIYTRIGAPAGASVSADVAAIKAVDDAVKVQTDKMTFTVANVMDANVLRINGDATAAADLAQSADTIVRGTCSGGTTTTAVVSALVNPSSLTDAGQLIGRTIIFKGSTGTANVQAQASNITNSTTGSTPTITFTAMTTAPANGDTFVVV
jgi:hypothetical protein